MHAIVRRIFGRLRSLNPIEEEAKLADPDSDAEGNELRMNVQATEEAGHSEEVTAVESVLVGEEKDEPAESPAPKEQTSAPPIPSTVRSDCTLDSHFNLP